MKGRSRILVFAAAMLIAAAVVLPLAQAAGERRGNDWVMEMARANLQRPEPGATSAGWGTPTTTAVLSPVAATPREAFDWADAGIGAAAMLGIVVLAGGLGAAAVLRANRGEVRSA